MKHITIQVSDSNIAITCHRANRPTLMLLHEGLGSVGMWRHFPEKLAARPGAGSLSGRGPAMAARKPTAPARALHASRGEEMLPALVAALGIDRPS
jgi:hypothetical protein